MSVFKVNVSIGHRFVAQTTIVANVGHLPPVNTLVA